MAPWWQTEVVYQIYPRSFADTNSDGVGDLRGIESHLDHLASLGVGAVWLSPIFPSPMADFGYDVADYCDVDPLFGTLGDLDRLLAEAHARDLKVMLDWVPNHTSDQHPWFVESRSSRTNPKRDWYVWRDPGPNGELPNNWVAAFTKQPAWTLDPATGQLYLHLFLPVQPDLNWDNPEVVAAMHDVLRFWLDRGIDGFRIDVVHALGKDIDQDDPEDWVAQKLPHASLNDHPQTHEHLRALRRLLDSYPGDRAMVGEVFLLDTTKVAAYYGHGDELHMSFNFPFLFAPWDGEALRERIEQSYSLFEPVGAWPTWVLSNHDAVRHRTRYGGPEPRARAAAVLLLTLRGTPFVYQGEELGLENAVIPPERVVDPGGRDGCRAPIPWTPAPDHGWPANPWLPFPPEPATRNVASFDRDDGSILALYRRLLRLRRSSAALRTGAFAWLASPDGVLAYERAEGGEVLWVVVNPTPEEQAVELPAAATVVIATDGTGASGREGGPFRGRVRSDTAVVLTPTSGA